MASRVGALTVSPGGGRARLPLVGLSCQASHSSEQPHAQSNLNLFLPWEPLRPASRQRLNWPEHLASESLAASSASPTPIALPSMLPHARGVTEQNTPTRQGRRPRPQWNDAREEGEGVHTRPRFRWHDVADQPAAANQEASPPVGGPQPCDSKCMSSHPSPSLSCPRRETQCACPRTCATGKNSTACIRRLKPIRFEQSSS
jgi:hypothetical protein